ncbi:MAG: hypothetical protein KJP16_10405 [Gammaproteobacteria bacterium]|nr:hypothetical protein [Gammaproteobacteria bacterium]NNL51219.1 hypothetical protein [Woeseiaceae bacterium]
MIEIDESMLVRLAGVRAFGQGLHCFEEGGVRDIVTTETTTNALVQEGRQHVVCLRHTHRMMEGECDCEVSDGIEFCQHCVAVALHLQAQQNLPKRIDKRGALRLIRRHLSTLTHEELLEAFLETIKQDKALRDDWLQKARLSTEAMSYSELEKIIDAVGAEDYLYGPREIRRYFQGLESMLTRLTEFGDKLEPLVLLRSVEHAIRRFNTDLALIDYAGDLPELSIDMLIDLHRTAMGRLNWTPKELASYLFDRGIGEHWHPFGSLVELYCEDLGAAFQKAVVAEKADQGNCS